MVRHLLRTCKKNDEGQSLVETALLLPLMLIVVFNAVNTGYCFYVMLNLTTAPRQGAEYSIQGGQSTLASALPNAGPSTNSASVSGLVYADISGAIASAANAPVRVCTTSNGLNNKGTASQSAVCTSYGDTGSFTTPDLDPEAPAFVLHRVDIQYTVAPLIKGAAFNLVLPSSITFHRQAEMRAMQ